MNTGSKLIVIFEDLKDVRSPEKVTWLMLKPMSVLIGLRGNPDTICPVMEPSVELEIISNLFNPHLFYLTHRVRVIRVGRAREKTLNIIFTITKKLNQKSFWIQKSSPTMESNEKWTHKQNRDRLIDREQADRSGQGWGAGYGVEGSSQKAKGLVDMDSSLVVVVGGRVGGEVEEG